MSLVPEAVTMRPEMGSEQEEQVSVGAVEVLPLSHGRRDALAEGNVAGVVAVCFGKGRGADLAAGCWLEVSSVAETDMLGVVSDSTMIPGIAAPSSGTLMVGTTGAERTGSSIEGTGLG